MKPTTVIDELPIGGEPRVDLLPPETRSSNKARVVRRRFSLIIAGVLVLVVGCSFAASQYAAVTQANLAAAQQRNSTLQLAETKFSAVHKAETEIASVTAARQVGASAEIDWEEYLLGVRSLLPGDVSVDAIKLEAALPFQLFAQATVALQPARVATLTLTLTSPNLPPVPAWLDKLKTLTGYADATPSATTRNDTGTYTVTLVLHVTDAAYTNRFAEATTK